MRKSEQGKIWKRFAVLIIAIVLLGLFAGQNVEARAGGGGSGGSSGGSSSGGSGGGYYNNGYYGGRRSNPISSLLGYMVFGAAFCGGAVVFTYKVQKARMRSKKLMNYYAKRGSNWNYREVQREIKKAYFEIQECWRRQDASYAKDFMSEECYQDFRMKLEWIAVKNEQVVQKNVRLLSATPVFVHDEDGGANDQMWYLIHGKMTGFYIDKDTNMLTRGNPKPEAFYEYWSFVYRSNRWVLDKIKQKDEMDLDQLMGVQGKS